MPQRWGSSGGIGLQNFLGDGEPEALGGGAQELSELGLPVEALYNGPLYQACAPVDLNSPVGDLGGRL